MLIAYSLSTSRHSMSSAARLRDAPTWSTACADLCYRPKRLKCCRLWRHEAAQATPVDSRAADTVLEAVLLGDRPSGRDPVGAALVHDQVVGCRKRGRVDGVLLGPPLC